MTRGPSLMGSSLVRFGITAAIGAGGMGEVYRARDTRLECEVAIKVLSADLATDPERLARFEREAKLLAALNHTSIAHVYGFESTKLARPCTSSLLTRDRDFSLFEELRTRNPFA